MEMLAKIRVNTFVETSTLLELSLDCKNCDAGIYYYFNDLNVIETTECSKCGKEWGVELTDE